jgi:hypothetical protein
LREIWAQKGKYGRESGANKDGTEQEFRITRNRVSCQVAAFRSFPPSGASHQGIALQIAEKHEPRIRVSLLQLAEKSRVCACFWVAQRFTAAITGLFSAPALAAAVTLRREKHFFRSLFSDTESRARSAAPLGDERPPGNSSQSASDRHHRRAIPPHATMTSDPAKPELSTL